MSVRLSGALMGPSALLFDLDGTLLDSAPDLASATDRMLVDLGFEAAGEARVRQWIGNGSRKLVQRAIAFATGVPEESVAETAVDQAQPVFMRRYGECCTERSRLYAGVYEALLHWGERGVPMACVTNKPGRFTDTLLRHFGLDGWMPVAVSGDTLPVRKPDPAPLRFACEKLGVDAAAAIMIGDSRNDVLAARAADMRVICVSYGYNYGRPAALESPDGVVDSLLELI